MGCRIVLLDANTCFFSSDVASRVWPILAASLLIFANVSHFLMMRHRIFQLFTPKQPKLCVTLAHSFHAPPFIYRGVWAGPTNLRYAMQRRSCFSFEYYEKQACFVKKQPKLCEVPYVGIRKKTQFCSSFCLRLLE